MDTGEQRQETVELAIGKAVRQRGSSRQMGRTICWAIQPQRAAFTLVELVTVVLIMGIMAAVAVPSYVDSVCRFRVKAAARRIATDLEFARQNAKTEALTQRVNFDPNSDSYNLQGMKSLRGRPYNVKLAETQYPASIVSADFGGNTEFDYNIFGRPTVGGTIVLECGGYQKTVRVNRVTGRATVE